MKAPTHTMTASTMRSSPLVTAVLVAVSIGAWAGVGVSVKALSNNTNVTMSDTVVPGDVNKDGSITIADVTMLVNQVLGKDIPTPAADVNGDGRVTIADVTELVNIVLGKSQGEVDDGTIGTGDPTDDPD